MEKLNKTQTTNKQEKSKKTKEIALLQLQSLGDQILNVPEATFTIFSICGIFLKIIIHFTAFSLVREKKKTIEKKNS